MTWAKTTFAHCDADIMPLDSTTMAYAEHVQRQRCQRASLCRLGWSSLLHASSSKSIERLRMGLVERFRNCCCRKILSIVIWSYSKGHFFCSLYCNNTYCANLCYLAEMIEDNSRPPSSRRRTYHSTTFACDSQSKGYSVNCAITFHFVYILCHQSSSKALAWRREEHLRSGEHPPTFSEGVNQDELMIIIIRHPV